MEVKKAALVRENDWTPEEREELAWKTRMFRRWVRTNGRAPLDIDPAHGETDLPRVSSQAGFAAIYDWMKKKKVKMSSPFDPAYKAVWREDNSYTEKEKMELHRLVEEIDVQHQRGYLPKSPARSLAKKLKEQASPQEVRAFLADEVQFTAFHPATARVKGWHTMMVYVHRASALTAVQRDIRKFMDEISTPLEVRAADTTHLIRGTPITIIPSCNDVQFNPEQVTFRWLEEFHPARFRLYSDKPTAKRARKGFIEFFANGLLIGRLQFGLRFSKSKTMPSSKTWETQITGRMLLDSQVFISYSRKDVEMVSLMREFIRGLGYRTLMDIHDLRTSQNWEKGLRKMIEQADVFQLFWSKNSAASENVAKEWRHALKCKKVVVPVYWKKPLSPLPPRPLDSIHFGYLPIAELKG
ncbi:MAG TPA: toll/interleukin-1 receptor domain-containing protein [Anaerolineales bacterium]|nr:toll/interleukin-1 receptor domain-containing protein [Anaerolineales bacterium]